MIEPKSVSREIAGRTLTIETGKIARQANGAVIVRYGETVVLVTAVMSPEPREGVDFLPLTVDYEERLYAAGKIPGGFIRREGRPSQEATLASRLVDRTIRPLLPKTWRKEIQIVITVLSTDQENDPNLLGIVGASAALCLSEIPFDGPVSGVTVGYLDDKLELNPVLPRLAESSLDLVICSTRKNVNMVEAGANQMSEQVIADAMKYGHEANQAILDLQEEFLEGIRKPKCDAPPVWDKPEIMAAVTGMVNASSYQVMGQPDREVRENATAQLKAEIVEKLKETYAEEDISCAFESLMKAQLRSTVLEKSQRIDGRSLTQIRPLSCEVGLLPRTHGSGLFNRGETQVMTIATLGSMSERQQLDGLGLEETKHYLHHYNFPPYSTGEVRRIGTVGRREIGHGALAERALLPVVPSDTEFPYTIRLVSEVLGSNGSTSMASTCASSLALMDAGVPIKKQVAGIAMGLITDDNGKYAVLTDIAGVEDFYGDMDFKVAGTDEGITAIQLDIKLKGVSLEILNAAVNQAREARMYVLDVMNKTINAPRANMSPYAPRMYKIKINPEKIGTVIGPGGKMIRSIIDQTKSTIDIDDSGTVVIGSADEKSAQRAIEIIEGLTREIEVGSIYTGKVSRILNFGAMVEILPGKEGLVHVSELADHRVAKVEDVVKIGEEITVKVIDIDHMGRVNLSRKAMFEKPGEERARQENRRNFPPQRGAGNERPRRFNERR
ncbi:MAG: polyribonucleotide nucleotidyltransferase [Dehalococcoidales bacterium]|nr:polyribonucleotide nucleotidyltransferase [Dehalococcoidales bacterium]